MNKASHFNVVWLVWVRRSRRLATLYWVVRRLMSLLRCQLALFVHGDEDAASGPLAEVLPWSIGSALHCVRPWHLQ